jgi:hypothetical protein
VAKTLAGGKKAQPRPQVSPRQRAVQRAAELEARCPFCRDEIQVEAQGWTCCSLCLSRHHNECWREHGCCASCGGDQNLTFVTVRDDLRRRRRPVEAPAPRRLQRALTWLGAAALTLAVLYTLSLGFQISFYPLG